MFTPIDAHRCAKHAPPRQESPSPCRRRTRNFTNPLACLLAALWLLPVCGNAYALAAPRSDEAESPRVRALLAQAWANESARGLRQNRPLASLLYQQAGLLGSAEGYYRSARLQLALGRGKGPLLSAACLFSAASQLGHHAAQDALESLSPRLGSTGLACSETPTFFALYQQFDLDAYLRALPPPRQQIVRLIRTLAPKYGVDPRLALAVATVESNLDPWAVSPKNAMGVMQLIPATAERFNVRQPFNAEQNIHGGLAYLRWLKTYYAGDTVRVLAAYNAGEKAVDRYGGIPPYQETLAYVARVMGYSGRNIPGQEMPKKSH